jgi:hypothetical protein
MAKKISPSFNRFLYFGFVLFGFYSILFKHNWGDAVMYLGIALAFDPFDQEVSWKERPLWQRTSMVIHLAIVAACFGMEVGTNDSVAAGVRDGWNGK